MEAFWKAIEKKIDSSKGVEITAKIIFAILCAFVFYMVFFV